MRNTRCPSLRFSALLALAGLGLVSLAGCPRQVDPLPDVVLPDFDAGPEQIDAGDSGPPPEGCTAPGSTLGMECTGNAQCSDGCFCNGLEECRAGTCQAGTTPCREDEHACTTTMCNEGTDRCSVLTDDAMCTNGDACDGTEVCNQARGCVPGPAPVCNDESSCTVDSCDPATGCVYTPRDLDGDGYVASTCEGGTDCDDDPRYGTMVYPGAMEICDNRRDDDCDGARDFNDDACNPTNDTCDVATVLTLGPMGGTFSGATTGLRNNYRLGCSTGTGPDAVFRFTLAEMRDVRISVTAAGASVALRQFDQCASGPDDKCNTGSPPTIVRRSLPAGEYGIIVSTTTAQAFDISIRLSDPTVAPPIDVCNATTTMITGTGGTFAGRFEEVEDDYRLGCNATSTRDAVYAFEVPPGGLKDLVVTATTTGGSWSQAYVALTTDCGVSSAYLGCETDGTSTTFTRNRIGPGRYYIVVEPSATDATDYSLTVSLVDTPPPAPGDLCTNPIEVTPASIPGMRSGSTDVARLMLDNATSCAPAGSGRDAVWTFTTTAVQDVTVSVSGVTGVIYGALRGTCAPSSDLRCTSGSASLSQNYRSLPAGTYYFVAQTTSTTGTLNATVDIRAPTPIPMNDRCPGITLASGTTRMDTTVDFASEVDMGTCAASGRGFPDAFYQFTLPSRQRVVASATRPAGGAIYMGISSTCASPTSLVCDSAGTTSASVSTTLDAGTYYLWVETPTTATSDYTLDFVAF
jgi:hypothetical protein